jgi:hypothetical protein
MGMKKIKIRFNCKQQQKQYENLIRDGYHWKTSEQKVKKIWQEHGYDK